MEEEIQGREKPKKVPEKVMKLKESSHLLAEVLYAEGVDIYKLTQEELGKLSPKIEEVRKKIDTVLKREFNIGFKELDTLKPKELQKIRQTFLGHYRENVENAEKLKKWIPLNQLVGYTEVLVASAYRQLNIALETDIEHAVNSDTQTGFSLNKYQIGYKRMEVLNALKRVNQGKSWESVKKEVKKCLEGMHVSDELFTSWRKTFEGINHPLQALYAEHVETMVINDAIYDLQYSEQKRSKIISSIFGEGTRSWKPADLEHDIHAQSAEVNRSIIELACNGIDANSEETKKVDLTINESGYKVRDYGSGMNHYVILEKLMLPKVSGKTGEKTIGRFGVGFYTVLSHLKYKEDIVRVETSDGETGHIIEFKIHERTGDVFVHTERNDDLEKGTEISVEAQNFNAEDAKRLCKEILEYNDRNEININGEQINEMEGIESIQGENTSLKYSKEISNSTEVALMINGATIERINITGENVCSKLALDLPLTCSIPESRAELALDSIAIESIKEIITNIFAENIEDEEKIVICNTLYPLLLKLQTRVRGGKTADNLPNTLQKKFKEHIITEGINFLPNTKAFQSLHVSNTLLLDSRIHSSDLESIPGITKSDSFESGLGYTLFVADFTEGQTDFIVEDNKRLVINRAIYEQHKDNPAALNVYLSNLDYTSQNKTEKEKGRILSDEEKREKEKKKNKRLTTLQEIAPEGEPQAGLDVIRYLNLEEVTGMTEQEIISFFNLPEEVQLYQLKEHLLSQITVRKKRTRERAWDQVPKEREGEWDQTPKESEKTNEVTEKIKRLFDNYSQNEWIKKIEEIKTQEGVEVLFGTNLKNNNFYRMFQVVANTRKVPKLIQNLIRYKEYSVEKNPKLADPKLNYYFAKGEGRLCQFLELGLMYNLTELQEEFSGYEEGAFFRFMDLVNGITYLDLEENNTQEKVKYIYFEVIAKLSLSEQDRIIALLSISKSEDNPPFWHANSGEYQYVNKEIRGMVMYIVEGGEILSERKFDEVNIEQDEYQTQTLLSKLVQGKKDNEDLYQKFTGEPKELVDYTDKSQEGADASKVLREIMHSTKNQIVNEGYLWIREILQNSLDAVKKNREDFDETPKVEINAYLRKKLKQLSERELLAIITDKIIQFGYSSESVNNYFLPKIKEGLTNKKLTVSNFHKAIEYLQTLRSYHNKVYFSQEDVNSILQKFESQSETNPDLVIEATDPVGMNLNTIINYLLIPNESEKKYDEETTGKFGQGFFTIFGDAKEVTIKTSRDGIKTEYLKITPMKDAEGNILDFIVEMSSVEEDGFKGTVIQKVVDSDIPQVEAAFCKSAVVSYGGLMDRNAVKLNFGETEINKPITILAETEIPHLGPIRIYDASENSLTHNGLYVKDLDEELLGIIPQNIREIFEANGIVIDIPPSIGLVKSRGDIAKKQDVIPILTEHVPALALRAYLSSVVLGKAEIANIPYDYFETKKQIYLIDSSVEADVKAIKSGGGLSDYSDYLEDKNKLFLLLSLLPCVEVGPEKISIFELANKINSETESVDISKLPESIKEHVEYALKIKNIDSQSLQKAREEYGIPENTKSTLIMTDTILPEDDEPKEKASTYYAYNHLVTAILRYIDASNVTPKYYLRIDYTLAHAWRNSDSIGFNLNYLENQMPLLAEIIENKLPATDKKVQEFLEEVINLSSHERQHNLEGTEETYLTHNDEFFKGQRKVMSKLIQDNTVNFQNILDEIYKKFKPNVISAKELMEMMTA